MRASWKKSGDSSVVTLSGGIREEAQAPLSELAAALPKGPVVIDMEKVDHINSVGCGHWIRFVRSRDGLGPVALMNCHEGVVTYANLLPMFSRGVEIRSVHYPMRCGACRLHQRDARSHLGGFLVGELAPQTPGSKCPSNGCVNLTADLGC